MNQTKAQPVNQFVHLINGIECLNIEMGSPKNRIQELEEEIKQCGNKKHTLNRTTFLDLPKEMIEHVFTYLPITEVYCNVRNVCRMLCDIGDGYVQTGKHMKSNIP